MKKLTLLFALVVSLVAKADIEDYGCGWVFRASLVNYYDGKE
jgi:hypothetical protein